MDPALGIALGALAVTMIFLLALRVANWKGAPMSKHNRPERPPEVEIDIENRLPESVRHDIHEIRESLAELARLFRQFVLHPAEGFIITQLSGGTTMARFGQTINGIAVGATGVFQETPTPAGGALQAGNVPVWTADDATLGLTPSTDGTQVAVSVPSTSTSTSFNLTCSGVNSVGAAISTTVAVPILPAVAVPATGFDINQLS
jgi:hypothetical protein